MNRPLIISVSQMEAFDAESGEGCPRKWWSNKVLRIPEPQRDSQTFGSAFHAVCERFLLADYLGRDANGMPVELFPQGWERVVERNGSVGILSPLEQDVIRKLFSKMVEEGHIQRWQDCIPEYTFGAVWDGQPLVPICEHRGVTVGFTGKIDVLLQDTVLDWKTTKSRKYMKSGNKLRDSVQMLGYAKVLVRKAISEGRPAPDRVQLVHVAACKNPDDLLVRRTPVWVSLEEIEFGWQRIQRLARQMVDTKLDFESEERWFDVPGPAEGGRACNAFGGCPRQLVCTGRFSVQHHRNIIQRGISDSKAASPPPLLLGNPMGILKDRVAAVAAPQGQVPPVSMPAAAQSAPVAQVAPIVAPPSTASVPPPWADPNCTSCGSSEHPGWNTAGSPCRICDGTSGSQGRPISAHFQIAAGDGIRRWTARAEMEAALRSAGYQTQGVSAVKPTSPVASAEAPGAYQLAPALQPVQQQPAPVAQPIIAPQPVQQVQPIVQPVQQVQQAQPVAQELPQPQNAQQEPVTPTGALIADEETVKPKGTRGRPKSSFTLYINCAPVSVPGPVILLEDVFHRLGAKLAEASGAQSYWELHPFVRRDRLAATSQSVAEFLGKAHVIVSGKNPDIVAFCDSLRPFAGGVVEAIVSPLVDGN